jgi:hypothetical protein
MDEETRLTGRAASLGVEKLAEKGFRRKRGDALGTGGRGC